MTDRVTPPYESGNPDGLDPWTGLPLETDVVPVVEPAIKPDEVIPPGYILMNLEGWQGWGRTFGWVSWHDEDDSQS